VDIRKIFVVGSGTMGHGIVQVAAQSGYAVELCGRTNDSVAKAIAKVIGNIEKRVEKGKMTREEATASIGSISGTTRLEDAADADLVIEAVIEDMAVKKEMMNTLDRICKPETILSSNTSSMSITEIAASTRRPGKVLGMHFFNPVPALKLLEIIAGHLTSPETVAAVDAVGKQMGKVNIVAKDKAGFVVSRCFDVMLNEAIWILEDGVATPEDIDNGMIYGVNHPMGPLAVTDMIGLDVLLAVLEFLQRESGDPKYRPAPLLRKMVRAGLLGRKTGQGFYKYDQENTQ